MALKEYEWRGATYQFDDASAPEGAVEVKAVTPKNKQASPENKAVEHVDPKPRGKQRKSAS